ncbi:MAG: GTPase [Erysipelotrichaceae bacterium]|nr:GTPase [Erysipelotrichaceae bacterium]
MIMREIPLFIINGFLESGKTTIIKEIIDNNEAYKNNSTVVIHCEDGEVEYDKEWCLNNKVHVEYVEDQAELTPDFMRNIDDIYHPNQIVIEYNSFFDWESQEFPNDMVIYQQITMIDAQTFNVMFNNMRQIFQSMVKDSSLVIFNRCDGVKDLSAYRRWIRGMNQNAQIAFEGANGRLTAMLDEDLPYDLSKSEIAFEEDVYPTWYIEVFDNPEKYMNKIFKFKTYVRDITDNTFVIGRQVMTCCEDDIQFMGYEVINDTDSSVKVDDCIYLECSVEMAYSNIAENTVVMLRAHKISKLKKEKETILTL